VKREPKGFIVGTGRSGSGYISKVLRACNVNCGHEEWWPYHKTDHLDYDSSWPALCRIKDHFEGPIIHQVRDPLKVIASLVSCVPQGIFMDYRLRVIEWHEDVLERSMRIYLGFNGLAEQRAIWRWRLEDLGPVVIQFIASLVEKEVSFEEASMALGMTAPFNKHNINDFRLTWDDLPDGKTKNELLIMAERYGYLY
jgi:hypothetical protein